MAYNHFSSLSNISVSFFIYIVCILYFDMLVTLATIFLLLYFSSNRHSAFGSQHTAYILQFTDKLTARG